MEAVAALTFWQALTQWDWTSTNFSQIWSQFADDALAYVNESAEALLFAVLAYLIVCLGAFLAAIRFNKKNSAKWRIPSECKRILIVTAHPDDETMFFGPTVLSLLQDSAVRVYLLCFSYGCEDDSRHIRKKELWKACQILGIPNENITICNHSALKDNPSIRWPPQPIAQILLHHVASLDIDAVITFDQHGVSQHLNHSSLFWAVAALCLEKQLPCRAYILDSINLFRKYSAMFDVPLSYLMSDVIYVISTKQRRTLIEAMSAHNSQFVWFRRLYLIFARYSLTNTLRLLDLEDLRFDLEEFDPSAS